MLKNDSVGRETELRSLIEADCKRVRKLSTLSEQDRTGKYRDAIKKLFDRLFENGSEYLGISVFGRMLAPTNEQTFLERFDAGWLQSEAFRTKKAETRKVLEQGNYDGFLQCCMEFRNKSKEIVEAFGGMEVTDGD